MIVRRLSSFFALLLLTSVPVLGQIAFDPSTADATPDGKFKALVQEAQTLQSRKHYEEALAKLDDADKVKPDTAEVHNIRGAIYLSSPKPDFDKAREEFKKATALEPEAMPPQFNMAEADYVQGNYAEGEKGFAALLGKFQKLPAAVRHMILFKQIVCMVKQDKVAEASQLADASFTFMDDSPAYYFCKSVLAFQKKDEKTGNAWLAKAQVIFKKTETSAYLDTLIEGHYLATPGGAAAK